MPKWKQNGEYNDSSQQPVQQAKVEEQPVDIIEDEETGKKKFKISLPVAAIGLAVLILGGIVLAAWAWAHNNQQMNNPEEAPSEDVGTIDDDWMNQYIIAFQYTAEEKEQLRAWGYTGTEIEEYQSQEVPAADLIAESKRIQEEARAALANPESPEFLHILGQTWLGEDAVDVPMYEEGVTRLTFITVRVNADYEKCEAHGTNLMLKVTLSDGGHHFMEVNPVQWSRLADEGNIVVDYTLYTLDGKQFIANMREVEV